MKRKTKKNKIATAASTTVLTISKSAYDSIRRHGEQTYPCESCGVLLGHINGHGRLITSAVPCDNTRTDSPQNRYHIDPRDLVRIQREARERDQDILGFYHSHPDHPAHWSHTDLAEAHWFGCSYVITSVEQGKAAQTNSFLLDGTGEANKHLDQESIELASG